MNRATRQRRGVTLVELLAVVTLIGIFASVAMTRIGRTMLTNMGAQSECRRLALDLLQMQRAAISSGDPSGIVFTTGGAGITGYRVVTGLEQSGLNYATGGSTTDVDSARTFATDLKVTTSHSVLGYNFEGQAGSAYSIVLQGPNREYQIDVIPITGAITTTERFR